MISPVLGTGHSYKIEYIGDKWALMDQDGSKISEGKKNVYKSISFGLAKNQNSQRCF